MNITKDNVLWINSYGFDAFSIIISTELQNSFFDRFKKNEDDIDQLCGKYVLCFGKIRKSKKQKFCIELDDILKIVFK